MTRKFLTCVLVCAVSTTPALDAARSGASTLDCVSGASGAPVGGGISATVTRRCSVQLVAPDTGRHHEATPVVTVVDCGPPQVEGHALPLPKSICSIVHPMCDVAAASLLPKRLGRNQVVVTSYMDGSKAFEPQCNVRSRRARPQLTAAMVRDEAEKLLPHPMIGSAPPGHVTLVNIETVLWLATSSERRLGTVNLLGRRVDIRAHIERVAWDFGDDSSMTTDGLGTAYTNAHPCRTKQCPGYFGHTYADTGTMTITADLTWTGQFRVDGGGWQTIPGTVTAAATSTTIEVKEARGVLVPNP